MAYSGTSGYRSNTARDVSFTQGKRSTSKQVLTRQIMPVQGDRNVSAPNRPLREATYRR